MTTGRVVNAGIGLPPAEIEVKRFGVMERMIAEKVMPQLHWAVNFQVNLGIVVEGTTTSLSKHGTSSANSLLYGIVWL